MAEKPYATNRRLTPLTRRVADAAATFAEPLTDEPEFMHAVLCQVGLPRSEVTAREFTRSTGGASMLIEAGKWFDGMRYHDMPLPYGTRPRLVLFHVCSEAVRRKSQTVEVERSASAFLERLGIKKSGESFASFKRQMLALAACRMQIGYQTETKVVNLKCDPIQRFDAWTQSDNGQLGLWPGVIQLSTDFYETLREHAVPLDPRAIAALQNSALALDTYTWLAHRLWRIRQSRGVTLYWKNLKDQFGQEYRTDKDFKREFANALRKAHAVYPEAKLDIVRGGIRLLPSPPPVRRQQVLVALPTNSEPKAIAPPPSQARSPAVSVAPVEPPAFVALLQPETLRRARDIVGDQEEQVFGGYQWILSKSSRPFEDLDERFLSYLRSCYFNGRPPPPPVATTASPELRIVLSDRGRARAAEAAPGWDIGELERLWRAWIEKLGTVPDKPDAAFLGFVRKHVNTSRG